MVSAPLRVPGSDVRNNERGLMIQLTRLFDVHLGYVNTRYWYQQSGADESPAYSGPSYQAELNRMDQTGTVRIRLEGLPETTGVLGFSFENLDYTTTEDIIYAPPPARPH